MRKDATYRLLLCETLTLLHEGDAVGAERLLARGLAAIPMQFSVRPLEPRTCERERCHVVFRPMRDHARYCSETCQRSDAKRRARERRRTTTRNG